MQNASGAFVETEDDLSGGMANNDAQETISEELKEELQSKKNEDTTINQLDSKAESLKVNEIEKQKMNEANNKKDKEVESKLKLEEEEKKINENNKILGSDIKLNEKIFLYWSSEND